MVHGLSTPLGIAAIIMIIIGIIMVVIGIILLLSRQNKEKPWYVWLLLVGGLVVGIAGGVMLAIALSDKYDNEKHIIVHTETTPIVHTTSQPVKVIPSSTPIMLPQSQQQIGAVLTPTSTTTTNYYQQ